MLGCESRYRISVKHAVFCDWGSPLATRRVRAATGRGTPGSKRANRRYGSAPPGDPHCRIVGNASAV